MQGLSEKDCKIEEYSIESYETVGCVTSPDCYQTKNVFDEEYRVCENRNRWLDDFGWL